MAAPNGRLDSPPRHPASRRRGRVRRGPRAKAAPKEQPPRKLSGTSDRNPSKTLKSRAAALADGVSRDLITGLGDALRPMTEGASFPPRREGEHPCPPPAATPLPSSAPASP